MDHLYQFFFTFDIRFSYSGMLGTFLDSFWSNCAKNKQNPRFFYEKLKNHYMNTNKDRDASFVAF